MATCDEATCPECGGLGSFGGRRAVTPRRTCVLCGGRGKVSVSRPADARVRARLDENRRRGRRGLTKE